MHTLKSAIYENFYKKDTQKIPKIIFRIVLKRCKQLTTFDVVVNCL